MNQKANSNQRVIGLDAHPDTFTAAILTGTTPAAAITQNVFHKIPLEQLAASWTQKHTTTDDVIVLEASGNSFTIVRLLEGLNRRAIVLESNKRGKRKESHANNDKLSAVRIGKAYLAGTAKEVWVPDPKTQERRDWFHCHRKTVKRANQARSRLLSYLSDNGVRLEKGARLTDPGTGAVTLRQAKAWSTRQWQVIEGYLLELRHADEQRRHWRSLIAQEVAADPVLLSLTRLCGVREMIAFALGAIIGDIGRFASPKQLVKYVGLNPAFDDSGNNTWTGGIGGHGRRDLRSLLMEGAQSILRSARHPLAKWGKKLLCRKGAINLVVAAIARKLLVAVWYLLKGQWTPLEEIDEALALKVGKMITSVGAHGLNQLGKNRKTFRAEILDRLKTGRTYILKPNPPLALNTQ